MSINKNICHLIRGCFDVNEQVNHLTSFCFFFCSHLSEAPQRKHCYYAEITLVLVAASLTLAGSHSTQLPKQAVGLKFWRNWCFIFLFASAPHSKLSFTKRRHLLPLQLSTAASTLFYVFVGFHTLHFIHFTSYTCISYFLGLLAPYYYKQTKNHVLYAAINP